MRKLSQDPSGVIVAFRKRTKNGNGQKRQISLSLSNSPSRVWQTIKSKIIKSSNIELWVASDGILYVVSYFRKEETYLLINTAEDQVVLKEADDHLSTFLFCKKGKFIQLVPKNNPTFSFYISGKRG